MKKQFLAIALLASIGGAKASELVKAWGPAAVTALATYKGLEKAKKWDASINKGEEQLDKRRIANRESIFTTVGRIAGITGRGMLTATNEALMLTTLGLAAPQTRDVVLPAAAVGGLYIVGSRLLGANQRTNPTDMRKGTNFAFVGAILGGIYKSNVLPPFTALVNGILGRNSIPVVPVYPTFPQKGS
jgi:hypothetical protein